MNPSESKVNLLLQPVEYKIETTARGTWKKHLSASGQLFEEFTSHRQMWGMPFFHFTRGKDPATGKGKTARGFVAVGRKAVGVFALGQMAFGVVAVGQLSVGALLALGQLGVGPVAIGQAAVGVIFGLGQLATGFVAIGQLVLGYYALGQVGFGWHVWTPKGSDEAARHFFSFLLPRK
jgi:hypothetical protein